jgi:multidrug efflux pump subunit AcrA (membrane-fusion protein)
VIDGRLEDRGVRARCGTLDATGEHRVIPVDAVVAAGDPRSRTFAVRARMDDGDRRYKPGMTVTALVPLGRELERLTVGADAVLQHPAGGVIWTIVAGRAERVAVDVLFREGDRLAVEATGERGLAEGNPVVIEGAERLRPGQRVQIAGEGRESLDDGEEEAAPVIER